MEIYFPSSTLPKCYIKTKISKIHNRTYTNNIELIIFYVSKHHFLNSYIYYIPVTVKSFRTLF